MRHLLRDAVSSMRLGQCVVPVAEDRQLTTQRAADLLGVSRPHSVTLLDVGEMPSHKAGTHRRVYLKDLDAYRKVRDAARRSALDAMARDAFELGLYDRTGIPEGGADSFEGSAG